MGYREGFLGHLWTLPICRLQIPLGETDLVVTLLGTVGTSSWEGEAGVRLPVVSCRKEKH